MQPAVLAVVSCSCALLRLGHALIRGITRAQGALERVENAWDVVNELRTRQ